MLLDATVDWKEALCVLHVQWATFAWLLWVQLLILIARYIAQLLLNS